MLINSLKESHLDQLCRSPQGALRGTECPGQHGDYRGRKQTPPGDPYQWRTSTQSGVDEGRKGER